MRSLIRRVGEVCGEIPAAGLTKAHMLAYKSARMAMPYRLSNGERQLPLPELIARYEGRPEVERISAKTVQKDLSLLSALLEWAERHDLVADNPAKAVKLSKKALPDNQRAEFLPSEMTTLFSSAIYAAPHTASDSSSKGALYWLPLLGFYTGARLEELGQLQIEDVRQEAGIAYLRIDTLVDQEEEDGTVGRRRPSKTAGGKSIKTRTSRRSIPVHPVLLRLGFLDHVAEARRQGHGHVFPDLAAGSNGKRTSAFSKRFRRTLNRLGLKRPGLVFYSTRHNFKTACRAAGIPEEVHDALTGHAGGGVGRSYGHVPPTSMVEAIAKVRYPAIEAALKITA